MTSNSLKYPSAKFRFLKIKKNLGLLGAAASSSAKRGLRSVLAVFLYILGVNNVHESAWHRVRSNECWQGRWWWRRCRRHYRRDLHLLIFLLKVFLTQWNIFGHFPGWLINVTTLAIPHPSVLGDVTFHKQLKAPPSLFTYLSRGHPSAGKPASSDWTWSYAESQEANQPLANLLEQMKILARTLTGKSRRGTFCLLCSQGLHSLHATEETVWQSV